MSDPRSMYLLSEKSTVKSPQQTTAAPHVYDMPDPSRPINITRPRDRVNSLREPRYQSSSADTAPMYRILKRCSNSPHPPDLKNILATDRKLQQNFERLSISSSTDTSLPRRPLSAPTRLDGLPVVLPSPQPQRRFYETVPPSKYHKINTNYDAIHKCKSAGIIPYSIRNGDVYFLLQQAVSPVNKKTAGWNDFGGKRSSDQETTADIAAREFSEETSCLFYLTEKIKECDTSSEEKVTSNVSENNTLTGSENSAQNVAENVSDSSITSNEYKSVYDMLKNNETLQYSDQTVDKLKELIPISQKLFSHKISTSCPILYASSKEVYISYFVKVPYIEETDIPKAEDIHIPYDYRYIRNCKWFSVDEILSMNESEFHKRLQITKLQNRIRNYMMQKEFHE